MIAPSFRGIAAAHAARHKQGRAAALVFRTGTRPCAPATVAGTPSRGPVSVTISHARGTGRKNGPAARARVRHGESGEIPGVRSVRRGSDTKWPRISGPDT